MMDPHGGTLVNLLADPSKDDRSDTPTLVLSRRAAADFEMLASGALSPLTGFMGKTDYESVLN
ncbi:MAG: sulfate adenylyltransferase, partial [Candidatus Marinimicrobia bacterium]|nr:sulfate adenylyltransferase [Candidatus Neomarinimicrobiota bacterium]